MEFEWLNDTSRKFLANGYLLEGEEPEQRIKDVCDAAEKYLGIEGFSDKMYDYMSRGWISLSSPVWSNYGREARGLPVSCFGGTTPDNVPGIMYFQSETGLLSKMGGGTSGFFGSIRQRGSTITGNGRTGGAVHFMQLFEKTTDVISQGGVRRGRMAPYLNIDHGDIDEFLDIGTEGNPIQSMTTGVTVSDDWMQAMIDGDSEKRQVWAKVLRRRKEIGFPYVMNADTMNRNKPQVYKDKGMEIVASNLCVAPETKILTSDGYIEIGTLENEDVTVWNGKEWSQTTVRKTGENQRLIKVVTANGMEVECTPYHKFYVQEKFGRSRVVEKRASQLQEGDKLIKVDSLPVIQGDMDLDDAYANGFYSGDGCLTKNGQRIYLYHNKRIDGVRDRLGDIFDNWAVQDNLDREYGHTDRLMDKFFVPTNSYTVESRLEWLAGIMDADGTVARNGSTQSLQLASINKVFLEDLQMMLQTLGVNSRVSFAREEGQYALPANNGTGENVMCNCQEVWRILIGQHEVNKLVDLGVRFSRLELDHEHRANRECGHFNKVVAVIDNGRFDDTYCFTESKRGMGMFNGILTGQCSEIALPSSEDETFVCVLSSLNLEKYDEWKDSDLVEVMTFFLDTVCEETIEKLEAMRDSTSKEQRMAFFYMERAYNFVKRHRALGLGSLGYHSFLQKNMIPFESKEAKDVNKKIHKQMFKQSQEASKKLAEIFGEPEILLGYGRRNTTTLAIAPTTSSAAILGQVSQSIEPWMSNNFIKNLAKMKVEIRNKYLGKLLEEKGMNTDEVWERIALNDGSVSNLSFLSDHEKSVFKTFREIDQYVIIEQAADRQKFLDQTQSLNLMLDATNTPKEINQLMIKAWKAGVCTLYYQHSVNAAQQAMQSKKNEDCEACSA